MDIRKALDLASTGSYLIPEIIDEGIRDYVSKEPVLYNALPKIPWATNTYFIRKRTALPTAAWRADGGTLPAADAQAFTKVSKTMKYLYARGEVTGPMQQAAGSLFNALAMEVEYHGRGMVELLSTALATATGSSEAMEGIIHQIDTNVDFVADENGELDVSSEDPKVLCKNMLDRAIDNSQGSVDLIVTSRRVRRAINSLVQAQQQFNDVVEIQAGFRVLAYDGIPIVTDLHWETDTDILLIRRADAKVLVHKDFTYEELAKTKDSVDFMIKWYGGFVLEGRPTHLKGFTLPTGVA